MPYSEEVLSFLLTIGRRDVRSADELVPPLALEFGFWVLALTLAAVLSYLRPRLLESGEALLDRWGRNRWRCVVMVGVLALGLRAALLPFIPIYEPANHDEDGYLLGADTFAAGRITSPTHPLWIHFESYNINMYPTYQSMYPPAQALVLSFGKRVFGHPWFGAWLSVGLMCAAVCWMLQGWMPGKWALLGGLFCVARFATFSYWMNSYMGGAVAGLAGALVYGALPRLKRHPSVSKSVLFSLGLVLLANARPYEGLLVSIPAVAAAGFWLARSWRPNPKVLRVVLAPAICMLLIAGALMAYYNWRSTGNAALMPYQANESQYHITKPFLWQHRNPVPEYHHLSMRVVYCYWELPNYLKSRTLPGLQEITLAKLNVYYMFFLWPLLAAAVPTCWIMLKSTRMRLLALATLLLLAGLLLLSWPAQGHYGAPATALVTAVALYALRLVRTWKPLGRPFGKQLARAVVLLIAGWMGVRTGQVMLNPYHLKLGVAAPMPLSVERARTLHDLEQRPGRHLVIVHEIIPPNRGEDWVYNRADIDHSKVVWARDMGSENNQELLRYYPDRQVWFVNFNDGFLHLIADNERSGDVLVASGLALVGHEQKNPATTGVSRHHPVSGALAKQEQQKPGLPLDGS